MNKRPICALLFLCACATGRPAGSPPTHASSGSTLWRSGLIFAKQGDPVRAEQYFSLATEHGVPSSQTFPHLVRSALKRSGYGAALIYTQRHLIAEPSDTRARLVLASLYEVLRQNDRSNLPRTVRANRNTPSNPSTLSSSLPRRCDTHDSY